MTTRTTDAAGRSGTETTRWRLDPERSSIEFRGTMLWGTTTVRGRFSAFHGTLDLAASPAAELTIETASLDTDNGLRDQHLRSPGVFGVAAHPYVRFVSDAATLDGERLLLRGRLLSRGVSLPLELEPLLLRDGDELALEAAAELDYRDIGLSWGKLWNRFGVVSPKSRVVIKGRLVRDRATPGG
jgi:polyisoprenoid-binding protein YceI